MPLARLQAADTAASYAASESRSLHKFASVRSLSALAASSQAGGRFGWPGAGSYTRSGGFSLRSRDPAIRCAVSAMARRPPA